VFVTSEFTGGACAIRRDVFVRLGGFREAIFHQGEERDFCVRLLADGWVVRLGRADPIHHYPSSTRDVRRMDVYGSRNTILCAWYNEPLPSALVRMLEMSVKGIALGVKLGRPLNKARGVLLGYRACWEQRRERQPVPPDVNRLFRRLWKHGPLALEEVRPLLRDRYGGRHAA
jgi:GT2 family glycosyltransferase